LIEVKERRRKSYHGSEREKAGEMIEEREGEG
jgi:hypothetical protein